MAFSEISSTAAPGEVRQFDHLAFSVTDENFHAIVTKLEQRSVKQGDHLGGNAHRKPGDRGTYFQDPTNGMHIQLRNSDLSDFSKQFAS